MGFALVPEANRRRMQENVERKTGGINRINDSDPYNIV